MIVASQLPDSHPSKKVAIDYARQYEEKYRAGSLSSFGAHMYDAYRLLAVAMPTALKAGKPGTPEFRKALRDAIESGEEVVGTHCVFNMTESDHFGHENRARALVRVEKGDWKPTRAASASTWNIGPCRRRIAGSCWSAGRWASGKASPTAR